MREMSPIFINNLRGNEELFPRTIPKRSYLCGSMPLYHQDFQLMKQIWDVLISRLCYSYADTKSATPFK